MKLKINGAPVAAEDNGAVSKLCYVRMGQVLADPVRPDGPVMDIPRQVPPTHAGKVTATWEGTAIGYSTEAACLEGRRCLRCDPE